LGYGDYALGKICVIFGLQKPAIFVHELLHMLNLGHPFAAQTPKNTLRSDYITKAKQTDNIMDYSHLIHVEQKTLFFWQWRIINKKLVT
jgi:hypothetical protein